MQERQKERRAGLERKAAEEYLTQAQGDSREQARLRQREKMRPGYTETVSKRLDAEVEKTERRSEKALDWQMRKSTAYWGDGQAAPAPVATPTAPAPTGGTTTTPTAAPKPQAAAAQSSDSGGAMADVPWRKRRVAPQGMTRAAPAGELSRLLGV